jgi:hypothetical protein
MNVTISKMGRAVSVAALGLGLLGSAGCDAAEKAAETCGLACTTDSEGKVLGVAEGNASISGLASIDGFFQSVVNFNKAATQVSADINAEIEGIGLAVGLDPSKIKASLEGKGDLGAEISGQLMADFGAELTINAQPPKCQVDASVTLEAQAKCNASANCEVEPGSVPKCMGECTAEVSASGECSAEAEIKCEVSGPSVECKGECSGGCEVVLEADLKCDASCTGSCNLEVAAQCDGTCNGTCDGSCSVMNTDGSCAGKCSGKCEGKCELEAGGSCAGKCEGKCEATGMAALNCDTKCSGSCKATPPSGKCEGSAQAKCEVMADAKAGCTASCDGEFVPPKANCEASASCEASAKADAKVSASCTPPSIAIDVKFSAKGKFDVSAEGQAGIDAQAKFDFVLGELKARLPRLLASLKKGEIVFQAGLDLAGDGKTAVEGSLKAIADGDINAVAAYRLTAGNCVVPELKKVASVIGDASVGVKGSFCAGFSLTAGLGGAEGLNPDAICGT